VELSIEEMVARNKARFVKDLARYGGLQEVQRPAGGEESRRPGRVPRLLPDRGRLGTGGPL